MNRTQWDVLALLGATLITVQTAESIIRLCMTFVFPKEGPVTFESLQAQKTEDAKHTLGSFLHQLRRRVSIEPTFDERLSRFLISRNTFVHRLKDVEGLDLHSPEGLRVARAFATDVFYQAGEVSKTFLGIVRAWQEQVGLEVAVPHPNFFDEVDQLYKPRVDEIFSKKLDVEAPQRGGGSPRRRR